MKVRCINEGLYDKITKNKIYSVIESNDESYLIVNENGIFYWYEKLCFEVVEDDIKISNTIKMSDLDSKIKELKEQLEVLIKAKEILEK